MVKAIIAKVEGYQGSLLRTTIYTLGHFVIAITCLMLIADVPLSVAATDAVVEPLVNAIWFFVLDRMWIAKK
tara:strand:+ start:273 stop:488 length:216 start_codon:yes stop_codon:yes gene_type:complete